MSFTLPAVNIALQVGAQQHAALGGHVALELAGDLNVALGAEGSLKDRAGGKKAGGGSGLGCLDRSVIHALFLRTRGALDLDGRALDLRRSSTCRLGAVSADAEHFVHSLLHVALLVHDFLCPP